MAAKTDYSFEVEPQDVDFTRHVTLSRLIGNALDVAGLDADAKGFGIRELSSENRSWVLSRMAVEIIGRPQQYTPYTVTTWVNEYGRLMSTRNFVFRNSGNAEIFGRAVTQWAMIDMDSRRPVDLRYIAERGDTICPDPSPCDKPSRLPAVAPHQTATHRIAYSDIDFNRHTNALRYIQLMIDMLPTELPAGTAPVRIEVNFLHETRLGQQLTVKYRQDDSVSFFEIDDNDGTTACRATFHWGYDGNSEE